MLRCTTQHHKLYIPSPPIYIDPGLINAELYELDIPVVLGSDAHDPSQIGWEFKSTIRKLKDIGYNQLAHFEIRKKTFLEI